MVPVVLWYHSAQLDELYNFGFSRRRPQGRFSSWKKLLAPPAEAYFFLKRRYAAECAVLRAARAQNAALVEKNGAARMRSRGGG